MRTIKCIICCIFIVNISTVGAQTDTTFSMVPSFDTAIAKEIITTTGLFKNKQYENVKHIDFDGTTLNITCEKNKLNDVVEKIKKVPLMWSGPMEKAKVQPSDSSRTTVEVSEPTHETEDGYDPKIDVFLNIEDSTIFSDEKFLDLEDEKIPQRSKSYYSLIKYIYQFKKKLEELQGLKYGKAELLLEIDELYGEIVNHKDVKYLTREHKDYFNNSLLIIYNGYDNVER